MLNRRLWRRWKSGNGNMTRWLRLLRRISVIPRSMIQRRGACIWIGFAITGSSTTPGNWSQSEWNRSSSCLSWRGGIGGRTSTSEEWRIVEIIEWQTSTMSVWRASCIFALGLSAHSFPNKYSTAASERRVKPTPMRRNIFFTNAQKYLFHQCAQMIHKFAQIFPHEFFTN